MLCMTILDNIQCFLKLFLSSLNGIIVFKYILQIQDMEVQLQRKTEGDDDIMLALNKKVAEWKVTKLQIL